jgi:integrase/recombinase XerC
VPLNKPVRDALEAWLKVRAKRVDVGDPALFVGPQGRRLSARAVDLVIRNTARRAGLELSAHVYADPVVMPTLARKPAHVGMLVALMSA